MDEIDKLVNAFAAKALLEISLKLALVACQSSLDGDKEEGDKLIEISKRLQNLGRQYGMIAGCEFEG